MDYLLLSFSHKNTNIVDRDNISFKDNKQLEIFMNRAKSYLTEIMILNTCNRVEFFITTPHLDKTINNLLHDISQHSNISFEELSNIVKVFKREGAIYHLFSVISSLESLVIGETQIVGQIFIMVLNALHIFDKRPLYHKKKFLLQVLLFQKQKRY